jgi:hypothetical protein
MERCGSAAELCGQIRGAPEAFYEWRRRSGDPRFDRAFGYVAQGSDAEMLGGMERQAREMEARLGVNFDMYTSEVIWTDRVYYLLPPEYRQRLFGGEAPRGDRYPTFAVTWPAAQADFARAVLEAGPDKLRLALYSFEPAEARIPLRVWRLKPGAYEWESRGARGTLLARGSVEVKTLPQVVEVVAPGRKEAIVTLARR